jgi:expansin (peptidoglycan-binding protein)
MRTALLCFVLGVGVAAQTGKSFKTRLSPVPIDITMQATIAGSGTVTAALAGSRLTLSGTFEGLKSPATVAKLRKSPVRGVRGPEVFDLTVTQAAAGSISGAFDLSPSQIADLQAGRLYIQINSERAPDGNLWGWLLEKR